MILVLTLFAAVVSALLTTFVIPLLVKMSEKGMLYDMPDNRKIHSIPISRMGGVCFLPIVIIVTSIVIYLSTPIGIEIDGADKYGLSILWRLITVSLSGIILFISGVYDDLHSLGYKEKFIFQVISALIICCGLYLPMFGFDYHFFIIFFFILYVVNAMNLIDGIDGLASGFGIISLTVLAIVHGILGNWFGAILAASFVGVLSTFYYYNVFSWENKIFMGDTGSFTIGLITAYLIISVSIIERRSSDEIYFYVPLCLSTLFIPLLDVMRVIHIRIKKHKHIFKADKNHIHHRLMEKGYTPNQVRRFLLFQTCVIIVVVWFSLIIFKLITNSPTP